ncbi:MAG: GFA family protein, partial [Polyangiales bacterium]
MKLPMDGGCRCERVRIRVTKAPMMTAVCHCRGCQRMSSSAFSATAICHAEAFEVTKGEAVLGGMRRADVQHLFCGDCMTWMFTRVPAIPHIANVRVTMFDDPSWFS